MVTESSIQFAAAAIITTTAPYLGYLSPQVATPSGFCHNNSILPPPKISKTSLPLPPPSVPTSKESPTLINPFNPLVHTFITCHLNIHSVNVYKGIYYVLGMVKRANICNTSK